jgi:tRNA/rRNA methyltransferase
MISSNTKCMNRRTVILVEPQQPDNVAAIARVMASFGFKELMLVNPLLNTKDIRPEMSRGGTHIIDDIIIHDSMKSIRQEHTLLIGTTAKKSLTRSYSKDHITITGMKELLEKNNGKAGIIFGREDRGLTNEELELCDYTVRIETSEEQRALNLSHAAAIILHSISQLELKNNDEPISSENKERIINEVRSIYALSSKKNNTYIQKREQTHAIVWRRMLGNTMLNDNHAKAIIGFLNETRKALQKDK